MNKHNCEVCGGPVKIHSSKEGTSHYESLHEAILKEERAKVWKQARNIIDEFGAMIGWDILNDKAKQEREK